MVISHKRVEYRTRVRNVQLKRIKAINSRERYRVYCSEKDPRILGAVRNSKYVLDRGVGWLIAPWSGALPVDVQPD